MPRNTLLQGIPGHKKAIDGIRTRGLHLGKVALYQLSYYRICQSFIATTK